MIEDDSEYPLNDWPLPNVWLGTTAENQEQADKRIPHLLQCPAAKRFVSVEPMLGQVELTKIIYNNKAHDCLATSSHRIDWVICGGESGPRARPMHPDWARSLRDQCKAASVPFFFKQWGAWKPWDNWTGDPAKWPAERVGKKKAGSLLDGAEHKEYPKGINHV
jgi:protein gp37